MTRIGTCTLGAGPRVAVAIRDGITRAEADRALTVGAHILELRVDQFAAKTPEHVLAEFAKFSGIPRIGTIRCADEGGAWTGSEEERRDLYAAIVPETDAIDIELNADQMNRDVIRHARKHGKTVIGSFHDFEKTPSMDVFYSLMDHAQRLEVDIVKVAAKCSTMDDLHILTRMLLEFESEHLILLGMGPHGTPTRFLFPALGSLLTYTFLGEPTAPGQMNLEQTLHLLKQLYPKI